MFPGLFYTWWLLHLFSTYNQASVETGERPHPSIDSLQIHKLILSSPVGKCTLDGHFLWRLGSTTCSSTPPGRGDGGWAEKKCPEQFAVRQGEPQSVGRVHFEAFMVSLVLLNGQNEIVFSHPELTALYSITELGGRNDFSDLSGQTVLYCLQNHCQFFSFFYKFKLIYKCFYVPHVW